MFEVCDNVYCYEDSCNVYVIKSNDEAILIDIGSGAVLDELSGIGITKVKSIYFTAPRRDRTAGLNRISEDTETFWPQNAKVYIQNLSQVNFDKPVIHDRFPGQYEVSRFYNMRYKRAEISEFGGMRLTPISATESMCGFSYALDIDGKIVCFSGECLFDKNKFYNAYNMEHMHHTGTGQRNAAIALDTLRLGRPDILCPAHGKIICGAEIISDCLAQSRDKLLELSELYFNSCPGATAAERIKIESETNGFQKLEKNMYMYGNSHILLSETGNALMVDFNFSTRELVEKWVADFKKCFGENCKIEKVLISHRHYDHWIGLNELRDYFDFSLECCSYMADDLEDQLCRKRPFGVFPSVKVDKRLDDGEKFKWYEYDFIAYHSPGQTDMHSGYYTEVDDTKVFYSGDNFYPPQQWGGTGGFSSFNGGDPKRGWLKSINLVLELEPDYILCGHMHPYHYRREEFLARRNWVEKITAIMEEVSPYLPYEINFDQHVFEAIPYTQKLQENFKVKVYFKNYDTYAHTVKIKPVLPAGVKLISDDCVTITAEGNSSAEYEFSFGASGELGDDKMITFDMYYDDRYLGERLEAFVY